MTCSKSAFRRATGPPPGAERETYIETHKNLTFPPGRGSVTGRVLLERKPVQIPDVLADPEYSNLEPQRLGGYRTHLGVPLMRNGSPIGVIMLSRRTVRPFDNKQIELVTTFADQAVIAIENVRLFDEVQARTSELACSVEELRALGEVSQAVNSTLDLQTVLDTIVAKAAQLSGTEAGAIYVRDERQEFQLRATYGMSEELIAAIRDMHSGISEAVGQLTEAHEPNQTADLGGPSSRGRTPVSNEDERHRSKGFAPSPTPLTSEAGAELNTAGRIVGRFRLTDSSSHERVRPAHRRRHLRSREGLRRHHPGRGSAGVRVIVERPAPSDRGAAAAE